MGYILGSVACKTSTMKWLKKGFDEPLWEIQVWCVGIMVFCLGVPGFSEVFWERVFGTCSRGWY